MQHYTKNTVSVSKWCNPCKRPTLHKVDNGRVGHCIPCQEKAEVEHQARVSQPPSTVAVQEDLFGAAHSQ